MLTALIILGPLAKVLSVVLWGIGLTMMSFCLVVWIICMVVATSLLLKPKTE